MTVKELIKEILEMLRAEPDIENKYHLVMAHNELMQVVVKDNEKNS